MAENLLFYGDNLDVLRRHFGDETVDLVYLDPPFNSDQSYNVLFKAQDGHRAAAQIQAFEETWRWDEAAAATYHACGHQGHVSCHRGCPEGSVTPCTRTP